MATSTFELQTPSFCDEQGQADSVLSYLENEVIAAIAEEVARPDRQTHADVALSSYVDYLRIRGAPPEAVVICVKKILHASAVSTLPQREASVYRSDIISRCIAAYFASARRRGE